MALDEILREVERDRVFYETSGGGVTVTGGEPLLQADFTAALLKRCHEAGIHTALETCGFAEEAVWREVIAHCDLLLFDIKETDEARHMEFTGVGLERIHANLRLLDDMGCHTILRCPMIPGVNDREAHFDAIADIANGLKHVIEINLEPYHPMGIEKSRRIGGEAAYSNEAFMEQAEAEAWREYLAGKTAVPVIIM
jgi:pyruvate formate lyase activating enzyme